MTTATVLVVIFMPLFDTCFQIFQVERFGESGDYVSKTTKFFWIPLAKTLVCET